MEILGIFLIAFSGVVWSDVYSGPKFSVTKAELVTAFICVVGVILVLKF